MTRLSLILAVATAVAAALTLTTEARAATSAVSTMSAVLGHQQKAAPPSHVRKAGVGFHLHIGPRRRYYRYRRYRRYHRPHFRLYIGPRRRYYRDRRYRRYRGRCRYWHRRCVRNWGYGNSNYYGCMRYHGCR